MTHFSDADGPRGVAHQMQVFNEMTRDLPGERSLSNSAATLRYSLPADASTVDPDTSVSSDWIRPGIVLYGSAPDHPAHTSAYWGLQPGMTLSSKIIATQSINAGANVGYGSTFVADQPMYIGVVACGYADGYPRVCPTGAPVLVAGVRTRLLGRVSMDMITVDLTPLTDAGLQVGFGTEVTLWGRASNGTVLGIDEVAHAAGTLGYELMCALAPRVPVVTD
jgi:alanine racemase